MTLTLTLTIERVVGAAIEPYLKDLAALRIQVFREFPYLYQGTLEYEARYLKSYANSERSLVVINYGDQAQMVSVPGLGAGVKLRGLYASPEVAGAGGAVGAAASAPGGLPGGLSAPPHSVQVFAVE